MRLLVELETTTEVHGGAVAVEVEPLELERPQHHLRLEMVVKAFLQVFLEPHTAMPQVEVEPHLTRV